MSGWVLRGLASALLVAAILRYVQQGRWVEMLPPLAFVLYGFVSVVIPDEMAEWSGRYGWTRRQWRHPPAWLIQAVGAIVLVAATIVLFAM